MKACSKQNRRKTRSKHLMNSMYLSCLYTNYSTLYREPLHKESKPNGQHMQPYINAHFVVNTNKNMRSQQKAQSICFNQWRERAGTVSAEAAKRNHMHNKTH